MKMSILITILLMLTACKSPNFTSSQMSMKYNQKFNFGDVAIVDNMDGTVGTYRILIHNTLSYNKAVWINIMGENVIDIIFDSLLEAERYANGYNDKGIVYKRIDKLDNILPSLIKNDVNFTSKIINQFYNEIDKIGRDKSMHFLANIGTFNLADSNSENNDEWSLYVDGIIESYRISIVKELKDKGLNSPENISFLNNILNQQKIYITQMTNFIINNKLDNNDLFADFIGLNLAASLHFYRCLVFNQN